MQTDKPDVVSKPAQPWTLTDWGRGWTRAYFEPIAAALGRLGLTPNGITLIGLGVNVIVAVLAATGQFLPAGLVLLLFGPLDALDGTLARLTNRRTRFGAFLDSTVDRYAEAAIFFGLLVYYTGQGRQTEPLLIYAAIVGSLLVSYTRSRAETLGLDCKVGLMTRVERWLVMVASFVFNLWPIGLWVLAVLSNFTAAQRVFHVWRGTHGTEG